ncbi:hypothetical protein RYH80_18505 [Halobaculum sp. MBLA0147]|uniref:hypothetical protein n=1 Tax=Halobaculum sp. MBLA0147 TaxID=3079934 RepID=UPI003523D6CF
MSPDDSPPENAEIRLEIKDTRKGHLLAYADIDADKGMRSMTDREREAHADLGNLIGKFDEEAVSPGVVGYVIENTEDGLVIEWTSEEAEKAAHTQGSNSTTD